MRCPHCLKTIHAEPHDDYIRWRGAAVIDQDGPWVVRAIKCPACERVIISLIAGQSYLDILAWPRGIARAPLPAEVPTEFAADYREACLVFSDSPKASAALSRRCVQRLLRDNAGVKPSDLSKEIDDVLASKALPSDLAAAIDAIRNIGNFAAHPQKSTNTGAIIEVEPGEAEWLLDVLESLFDFCFVRPAQLAAKRDALNKKLAEAGKPPMK